MGYGFLVYFFGVATNWGLTSLSEKKIIGLIPSLDDSLIFFAWKSLGKAQAHPLKLLPGDDYK